MCGIVGCVTAGEDATKTLMSGLKRLEYRGYDSAGIAVLDSGVIKTVREVGKIVNLETLLATDSPRGGIGLGHTRWATHGRPTEVNAHPHRDESGKIVVVHNGIIENFRELREDLKAHGHKFASDTDSEVIAHLVRHHFKGDLREAVREAILRLKGAYAIGVMNAETPDRIIGARRDSPLIIGIGDDENFLASDVTAVIERTDRVIYLGEGEIAEISRDGVKIIDDAGNDVALEIVKVDWNLQQAERGGYPHFMLKEINEQPIVVSDALMGRLDETEGSVNFENLKIPDDDLRKVAQVHIVACGTSWHSAQIAKFYLERFARLSAQVDYASEFRYRDPIVNKEDLLIAISQSGETADTLAAMRMAAKSGCRVISICNVIGSTMSRESHGTIMTHAGPEIGVASTKAFTSQLVVLIVLALKMGRLRGHLSADDLLAWSQKLRTLPHVIQTVLTTAPLIEQIAERYKDATDFLFIGRGLNYPIALEGALKLKEISYIHAEGYPAGEMKHGPIALIDDKLPLVAICTQSAVYDKVVTNVEEARVRDASVIAVANIGDDRVEQFADDIIFVPEVDEVLSPIVNVVPLQLLAYYIAQKRGCDVDQPRNLAKSVTVE
ncbi:MAG: glutamine--fructose-6-phosphate transaminase (isomerizing) [Planctomycetota bacterium]